MLVLNKARRKKEFKELIKNARSIMNTFNKNINLKFRFGRDILNLEDLYEDEMQRNTAFIIDCSIRYDEGRLNDYNALVDSDSIFSYKYGVTNKDPSTVQEKKFRCECSRTLSSSGGVMCLYCDTMTEYRPYINGWIIIPNGYRVFNPDYLFIFLNNFTKNTAKKIMNNLLYSKKKNNENSFTIESITNDKNELIKFINHYMADNKYSKVRKQLLDRVDSATTNVIPVMSKDLRPYSVHGTPQTGLKVESDPINTNYILISKQINNLDATTIGKTSSSNINNILMNITTNLLEIHDKVLQSLGSGKKSEIRGDTGGKKKSSSLRCILESNKSPDFDSCQMSAVFFAKTTIDLHREIYEKYGMTPESEYRIKKFIPNMLDNLLINAVFLELKERNDIYILAERQPAIYFISLIALKITSLLFNEYVIRVNDSVIVNGFSGDKDGDHLTVFMMSKEIGTIVYLSMNTSRLAYDPFTGLSSNKIEYTETNYIANYLTFPEDDNNIEIIDIDEKGKECKPYKYTRLTDDTLYKDLPPLYNPYKNNPI